METSIAGGVGMIKPNALVLTAPGINCNEKTAYALDQAGAQVDQVHISQLNSGEKRWDDYQILALSGGFSYGDDIAAGRILGLELRSRHPEALDQFAKTGKAIVGICNGFQVLMETGLLPDGQVRQVGTPKKATLAHNLSGRFEARWTTMAVADSNSRFISPELSEDSIIELPVAHGEGRAVYYKDGGFSSDQVALRYANEDGQVTMDYPANPNGSENGVAAITNLDGNILGLMPHPERFVNQHQHTNWRRGEGTRPFGAIIFKNLVNYIKEA
jgi:phosphoribosylformylglycinamidine synthase I